MGEISSSSNAMSAQGTIAERKRGWSRNPFPAGGGSLVSGLPVLLLDLDGQPFDFLIQRGERDVEAFRRFGLVPAALLQHVDDDPPFAVFHDAEQRGPRIRTQSWNRAAPAHDVVGQQVEPNVAVGR